MPHPWEFQTRSTLLPLEQPPTHLPFSVEVVGPATGAAAEVVGRATELSVATAIFHAATARHEGRAVVLKRGDTVLLRSGA